MGSFVLPAIVGMVVAGVVGYIAIRFMLSLISRVSLNWFALYVAILGLIFLTLQLLQLPQLSIPVFAPPAVEAQQAAACVRCMLM